MTDLREAYLVTGVRTPIGRYGGALATVRPDDLAAHVIRALTERLPTVDWAANDDVVLGCANQAGEDNRNVARMATLLAGLPETVSASTVNRLCGSGLDAMAIGARAIRTGDAELVIAGGVESMSRAPFVMGKAESAFARQAEIFDTTLSRRSRDPHRRCGARHRRRRGEHEPGAVRHGQGGVGLRPPGRDLRHHAELALARSAPAMRSSSSPAAWRA